MKINASQLAQHLQKTQEPIYIIYGDEPLLKIESKNLLKEFYKKHGYNEIKSFEVSGGFNWEQLLQYSNAPSLFSTGQIIDIHLTNGKIGKDGSKVLSSYVNNIPQNIILIISIDKYESSIEKNAWFKELQQKALCVASPRVPKYKFREWVISRLKGHQYTISLDALDYMVFKAEGNLLATHQIIEKIRLVHPPKELILEDLHPFAKNDAIYSLFELIDLALKGDLKGTFHAFDCLNQIGTEPILILWAVTREVRNILRIKLQQETEDRDLQTLMYSSGIHKLRIPIIKNACQRLSINNLETILKEAHDVDKSLKGASNVPKDHILNLLILLANSKTSFKNFSKTPEAIV